MPIRELFVECCGIICSVCGINTQKLGIVLKRVFCYLLDNQLFFCISQNLEHILYCFSYQMIEWINYYRTN